MTITVDLVVLGSCRAGRARGRVHDAPGRLVRERRGDARLSESAARTNGSNEAKSLRAECCHEH